MAVDENIKARIQAALDDPSSWNTLAYSELDGLLSELEAAGNRLDNVYAERNQLAMLAAVLAAGLGYNVGVRYDADEPDPEWPILFIDLPCGQVSWHIPRAELKPEEWKTYDGSWDGHTNQEKWARLDCYIGHGEPAEEWTHEQARASA